MGESMQAVKQMAGGVIDETDRQDFIVMVIVSSFIPLSGLLVEWELSIIAIGLMMVLWGYTIVALCIFSWLLKQWLGLSDDE